MVFMKEPTVWWVIIWFIPLLLGPWLYIRTGSLTSVEPQLWILRTAMITTRGLPVSNGRPTLVQTNTPKHNNGVGLQWPNWRKTMKWKLFLSFLPLFGKPLIQLLKNSQEPLIFSRWNFMNTASVVVKPWVRLAHEDHQDLILLDLHKMWILNVQPQHSNTNRTTQKLLNLHDFMLLITQTNQNSYLTSNLDKMQKMMKTIKP